MFYRSVFVLDCSVGPAEFGSGLEKGLSRNIKPRRFKFSKAALYSMFH